MKIRVKDYSEIFEYNLINNELLLMKQSLAKTHELLIKNKGMK